MPLPAVFPTVASYTVATTAQQTMILARDCVLDTRGAGPFCFVLFVETAFLVPWEAQTKNDKIRNSKCTRPYFVATYRK
jgi:hypothetical protein